MKNCLFILLIINNLIFSQDSIRYEKMLETIDVEIKDTLKTYDENFNLNNNVYIINKKFTFKYFYEDKEGKKYLMKKGKQIEQPGGYYTNDWDFTDINDLSNNVVKEILLTIIPGNPFEGRIKDYNQTGLSYKYITNNNSVYSSEKTGIVENQKNTWMHPPRNDLFQILELNPFPFIKTPLEIGNKWNWSLDIGDIWGDERWLKWKGLITNKYSYEITDIKEIQTFLGKINCYIIESKAISRIGETKLISYYNKEFGFVKMEYVNIDGSKLILELEKVE